jgi:hypothetical protein
MTNPAIAILGGPPRISSREWFPARSPTSLEKSRLLSSLEIRTRTSQAVTQSVSSEVRRWIEAVNGQLESLLHLEEDWDTYGSPPPATAAVRLAALLLQDAVSVDVPVPRVHGTSEGGVLIEWYRPAIEFALEVEPSGSDVTVFFLDRSSGDIREGSLADEQDVVAKAFHRLRQGF